MDEGFGKIQKVSTHVYSLIVVDVAIVESHVAAADVKTPALQRKGRVTERSSNGVMDECSGKVQKASTHAKSFIVVDVAIVESHVAAIDEDPPALPKKEGKCQGIFIQRGDG